LRIAVILLSFLALTGCTALAVGGSSGGSYQHGTDARPAGIVASDTSITSKIRNKYAADPVVSAFNISVRTYEGRVTLSGTVNSSVARNQALDLAKQTAGVRTVTNQIHIED